jgi:hypothetical protein
MITATTWAERLVLHPGWRRPPSKGGGLALIGCVLWAAIQLIAYQSSGELWRLWACAVFVILAAAGMERRLLYRVLARVEQRLAELEANEARRAAALASSLGVTSTSPSRAGGVTTR